MSERSGRAKGSELSGAALADPAHRPGPGSGRRDLCSRKLPEGPPRSRGLARGRGKAAGGAPGRGPGPRRPVSMAAGREGLKGGGGGGRRVARGHHRTHWSRGVLGPAAERSAPGARMAEATRLPSTPPRAESLQPLDKRGSVSLKTQCTFLTKTGFSSNHRDNSFSESGSV